MNTFFIYHTHIKVWSLHHFLKIFAPILHQSTPILSYITVQYRKLKKEKVLKMPYSQYFSLTPIFQDSISHNIYLGVKNIDFSSIFQPLFS